MELKDVIAGQYYAAWYSGDVHPTIIKVSSNGDFSHSPGIYQRLNDSQYNYLSDNSFQCKNKIRFATEKEIHWLDLCIQNNTIIPFEEAMKTYVEPITYSNEPDPELGKILTKLLNL